MDVPTLQASFGQLCSLGSGRGDDLAICMILILCLLLLWQYAASDI
jgi:hypothetical protein